VFFTKVIRVINQLKEEEIGRTTYGEHEKLIQNIYQKTWSKESTLRDLVINGRIILKWILKNLGMSVDWIQQTQGTSSYRLLWTQYKALGSLKGRKFPDQISSYQLLKRDCATEWLGSILKTFSHLEPGLLSGVLCWSFAMKIWYTANVSHLHMWLYY